MGLGMLSAEAGRQHGTTSSYLERRKVGPGWAFSKCLRHGANPAPADITSTGSQYSRGSTKICMLWNTSSCPMGSPLSPEWQNLLLWIYLLNFRLLPRNRHCSQLNLRLQNVPWRSNHLTHPEVDCSLNSRTGPYFSAGRTQPCCSMFYLPAELLLGLDLL